MSETNDNSVPAPAGPVARQEGEQAVPEISSTELFAGQRKVVITHAGERYRLIITRNEKLLLQK